MEYLIVKWLHILSSTLLFGTGIGSAWYLLFAVISRNVTSTVKMSIIGTRFSSLPLPLRARRAMRALA